MSSILMSTAQVGSESIIGAQHLVKPSKTCPQWGLADLDIHRAGGFGRKVVDNLPQNGNDDEGHNDGSWRQRG